MQQMYNLLWYVLMLWHQVLLGEVWAVVAVVVEVTVVNCLLPALLYAPLLGKANPSKLFSSYLWLFPRTLTVPQVYRQQYVVQVAQMTYNQYRSIPVHYPNQQSHRE